MPTPTEELYHELQTTKSAAQSVKALREFYRAADQNAGKMSASINLQVAFRDGCSYCCYQRVSVLAHEVFAVVDYVESHFTPTDKAALIERLTSYVAELASMTTQERDERSIACPLLLNDRCTVHPARPTNCRLFHSLDRSRCEELKAHPEIIENKRLPTSRNLTDLWERMTKDLDACFGLNGYDQRTYELGTACLAALTKSTYRRRWAQKKAALLHAPT